MTGSDKELLHKKLDRSVEVLNEAELPPNCKDWEEYHEKYQEEHEVYDQMADHWAR